MKDKKKRIVKRLAAVTLSLIIVLSQIGGTAPWNSGFAVRGAEVSSPIVLKRIDGSGEAFIYHINLYLGICSILVFYVVGGSVCHIRRL